MIAMRVCPSPVKCSTASSAPFWLLMVTVSVSARPDSRSKLIRMAPLLRTSSSISKLPPVEQLITPATLRSSSMRSAASWLVLDAFDKGSEEVITNVGDDHSDGSGLLGTEGARTTWLVIAITMDRGEDSLPGAGGNIVGSVERAGDGRDTEV